MSQKSFLGITTRPPTPELGSKGSFLRNATYALLGSIGLTVIFALIPGWFGSSTSLTDDIKNISYGIAIGMSIWLTCSYLNSWLSRTVDWLDRPLFAFAITLIVNVLAVTAIRFAVDLVFLNLVYPRPGVSILKRIFIESYIFSVAIALLITAIYQGAYFLKLWKIRFKESEQLKSANLAAKYEALNAQINPHFLFNSLNVLSALVQQDPDKAERFIAGLSNVYRYVLDVRLEPTVTIARELAAMRGYTELLQIRFGSQRLKIEEHFADESTGRIIPLALQMLVENAVKHNGATKTNPLMLSLGSKDGYYYVSNTKVPMFDEPEGKGIGLNNISERYQLAARQEIVVEDTPTSFTVKLPILYD